MHHYFEAITNRSGDSLVGYFVRVIDPTTLATVDIYSDNSGTPIFNTSGVENMAKTDENGNVSLYVEPGTYNVDIYQPDATTFIMRVPNVAMNSTKGDKGDPGEAGPAGPADNTYTSDNGGLGAFRASDISRATASLVGIPGVPDGRFNWTLGNYSATPAADLNVNIIKADSTALTVGAWVRQGADGIAYTSTAIGESGIVQKIERLRSSIANERRAILAPQGYSFSAPIGIWGQFSNDGVLIDGAQSVITPASGNDGIDIGTRVGQISNGYYSNVALQNFSAVGNGKTDGQSGIFARVTAGNFYTNIRVRNFGTGAYLLGGLSSNWYNLMAVANGVGLRAAYHDGADGLSVMGPNANSFFGPLIRQNDIGIDYGYSPSTAINFFGGVIEANNFTTGTMSDGKKVVNLNNAGHINFFGIHSESNKGQFGYHYTGFDASKKLLMVGCEVIDNTGELVHVERGTLCSIASRINNSGSISDVFLASGTYATLIDSEMRGIDGDISHVAAIRYGRIMLGGNPQATSAPFSIMSAPIAGNSNIAMEFRNDIAQIRFLNTAGTRTGYFQFSLSDHVFVNDNVGGWLFNGNGSAKLRIGAGGASNIEPGADNTIDCGSAVRRWKDVNAARLRPGPANGPVWTAGAGTPEGVLSAPVGSLYTRTDGGAGTTLYVKESGTGNTGWIAK